MTMVDTTCAHCRRRFGFADNGGQVFCPHCLTPWDRGEFDKVVADIRRMEDQHDAVIAIRAAIAKDRTLVPLATEIGVERMKLRALIVGEAALDDADITKVRAWMNRRER